MQARPTWHETHMEQAMVIAKRSTCLKKKVGCVLVKDHRVISEGYNGVGPGCTHCDVFWRDMYELNKEYNGEEKMPMEYEDYIKSESFRNDHKRWSNTYELHAEQNCILWAARNGIATNGTTLYTTYSPCIQCAKVIFMAGIKEVYYQNLYSDVNGIQYLRNNKIFCYKV
jgi:dCMP deaminase